MDSDDEAARELERKREERRKQRELELKKEEEELERRKQERERLRKEREEKLRQEEEEFNRQLEERRKQREEERQRREEEEKRAEEERQRELEERKKKREEERRKRQEEEERQEEERRRRREEFRKQLNVTADTVVATGDSIGSVTRSLSQTHLNANSTSVDDEAKKQEEERELKRKQREEERLKREAEEKRAEEERLEKQRIREEERRKQREAEEREEEERKKRQEEERLKREEERKRLREQLEREEEEKKQRAEEERKKREREEREAEERRKHEAEERKKQDEERKRQEEERRKQEEEGERLKQEKEKADREKRQREEENRQREEEQRREEEARRKQEDDERRRQEEERARSVENERNREQEEKERIRQEEEKQKKEDEDRKRREEEMRRLEQEEEELIRRELEEEDRKLAEAKKKREEEAAQRLKALQEEEEQLMREIEEEERRAAEKKKKEEDERKQAENKRIEDEKKKRAEEEAKKKELEAKKKQEEEAKKKSAEQRPRANTVAEPTPSPKKGAVAAAAKKGIANTPAPKPELKKRNSLEELRAKAEAERAQYHQARAGNSGGGMPGDPTAPKEYGPEEIQILFNYVNNTLANDAQVKALGQLPLKASSVDKHVADLTDGIVMCKFFDKMIPNTLDVRVINFKIQVKPRDQIENWNLCVNSGRAVGCRMNDIDTKELVKGNKEMLFKVIWQVIKVGLETKMKKNQNLIKKFMDSGEDMENMVRLASDKLITKWVNHTLRANGVSKQVEDITKDFKDSSAYATILHQFAPSLIDKKKILNENDMSKRAAIIVDLTDKFKIPGLITADGIANVFTATSVDQINKLMARHEKFVIAQMKELNLKIPMKATKYFQRAIKASKSLEYLEISELEFHMNEWEFISLGIIGNESISRLRFHNMELNERNIGYITQILRQNSRITSLRFDQIIFEANTFQILIESIRSMKKLESIEFSTSEISIEEVFMLKHALSECKRLTSTTLIQDPIYITTSESDVKRFTKEKKKFIIAGLTDLLIRSDLPANEIFRRALISTLTLLKVHICAEGLTTKQWEIISESLIKNESVTELTIKKTTITEHSIKFIIKIMQENKRIRTFRIEETKIESDLVIESLGEMICQNKNIQRLAFLGNKVSPDHMIALHEFIKSNTSITALEMTYLEVTPKLSQSFQQLLRQNTKISALRLRLGVFPWPRTKRYTLGNLTKLELDCVQIDNSRAQRFCEALKKNKNIHELKLQWSLSEEDNDIQLLADLLEVNSALKNLTIVEYLEDDVADRLIRSMAYNKTLKSLTMRIDELETLKKFSEFLQQNESIRSIELDIDDQYLVNNLHTISPLLENTKSITALSTPISSACIADLLHSLKNNTTISYLKFTTYNRSLLANRHLWMPKLRDLMLVNKALNTIVLPDLPQDIAQVLERNYMRQQIDIGITMCGIRMIALRSHVFAEMLPLEIWSMIFKFITFPGVGVDFSSEFNKMIV